MKEMYFKGSRIFEFNDDNAIQIVGNNNYLIRTILDVYYKLFSGYRFTDLDIEAMNGYYPEVRENGKILKKNDLIVIRLSEIVDILYQFTIKKGTILLDYLSLLNQEMLINETMEKIDKVLIELSIHIDNIIKEKLTTTNLFVKTDIKKINLDKIIKSFVDINFVNEYEERIPLWLLKDSQIVDLFTNAIELTLEKGKKTRVIIDRLDSKMEINEYRKMVEKLFELTEKYSNFGIWIIPSNKEGVFVDYRIFDNTYIINEEIIKLGDFDVTYESICRNYPDNNIPKKREVLYSLLQNLPFHKTTKQYLPTKETVITLIFLKLLGEEKIGEIKEINLSKLEYNFLTSFS